MDRVQNIAFDETSGRLIAAAIEVHRKLGPGFIESVYEQALRLELTKRKIHFVSQKHVQVLYDGTVVGSHVLDLVVEDCLVVELKSVQSLEKVHYAQLLSYLKATGYSTGLLLNFNEPRLAIKRVAN